MSAGARNWAGASAYRKRIPAATANINVIATAQGITGNHRGPTRSTKAEANCCTGERRCFGVSTVPAMDRVMCSRRAIKRNASINASAV